MNTEQLKQINNHLALIEAELGRIRVAIREASAPMPDGITGNSSDSPYAQADSHDPNHYMPKVGEVVLVGHRNLGERKRVFLRYQKESCEPYVCVDDELNHHSVKAYRNGDEFITNTWSRCRRLNGEIIEFGCDKVKQEGSFITDSEKADKTFDKLKYLHLLPEGYEFCAESEAEKWVKVENNIQTGYSIGEILLGNPMGELRKNSRPIRKISTASYAVDWTNAPDWADAHAFDEDGKGYWYGANSNVYKKEWGYDYECSNFTLSDGLDWKLSKTYRPR